MNTLRARVLTVAVLGLAFTVALLTASTAWLAYQRSLDVLDDDLQRQLVHILTEAAQRPVHEVLAEEPPASRVATFLVSDGRIVAASRGPQDVLTAADVADLSSVQGVTPVNIEAGDTTLRAVSQQITNSQTVVVAGEYDAVRAGAWRFAGLIAGVGLGCLVLGSLGTSWALNRAVRPVRDLASATSRVPAEQLRPVPVPDGPREVVEVAVELNGLLDRVRTEDARRNRFLATLSHEMRTPLTVARGQLEALALYGPGDDQDAQVTAGVAVEEIARASAMLDAFLSLARSQEPGFVVKQPTYLPDVAQDLRLRLSAMPVTVEQPSAATVPLDSERVGQAVLNCVTNALRSASVVQVGIDHSPTWLTITVDDDGDGWPADRNALLQPFTSGSGSSGLGLAVVDAITRAHAGEVELLDSPLGGARVSMRFPAS
jgi:two-component system, OmpR family, sensor kinase